MTKYCPNCKIKLIEVKKGYVPHKSGLELNFLYPREISEPNLTRTYHEYRFACKKCKQEWVYDSLWRCFSEVPATSQFQYSWSKKYLVLRNKEKI